MDVLGDGDLLALVRRGDEEALGVIYDRHIRTVWGVALALADDPAVAERAVLATFTRLWRGPEGGAGACLASTLVRGVAGEVRSRRRASRKRV